jgi:hypothetical protein
MKHAFRFELALPFALLLLSACATSNPTQMLSLDDLKAKANAACTSAAGPVDALVQVPASDTYFGNMQLVASVDVSGSDALDTIGTWLKGLSGPHSGALIVMGRNDEVTAATLRGALHRLPRDPARAPSSVCFVGDAKYAPGLKAAAEKTGVTVYTVQAS